MSKVIDFLKGKKTFIVGGLLILLGILQGDTETILEGLGLMTLRAGLGK